MVPTDHVGHYACRIAWLQDQARTSRIDAARAHYHGFFEEGEYQLRHARQCEARIALLQEHVAWLTRSR